MADYSKDELRTLRGVTKTNQSPRHDILEPTTKDVPVSWNWRLYGKYFTASASVLSFDIVEANGTSIKYHFRNEEG